MKLEISINYIRIKQMTKYLLTYRTNCGKQVNSFPMYMYKRVYNMLILCTIHWRMQHQAHYT